MTRMLSRRSAVLGLGSVGLTGVSTDAAEPDEITVYKTPSCGCCKNWVNHLQQAGFKTSIKEFDDLTPIRQRFGVPTNLSACHTGFVRKYVIEGHVPANDIKRLLRERPKALGLTVPGMPAGSPGMETPDGTKQPYTTLLLVNARGTTRMFARHG